MDACVTLHPLLVPVADERWAPVVGHLLQLPGGCELDACADGRFQVNDLALPPCRVALQGKQWSDCSAAPVGAGPRAQGRGVPAVRRADDFERWWRQRAAALGVEA